MIPHSYMIPKRGGSQYLQNFGMQVRRPMVLCCRYGPFPPVVATDLAI